MKLEYSLSNDDFLEHQLYIASKSERIIKKRQRTRVMVPILYLALGIFSFIQKDSYLMIIIFLTIAILWYVFYPIRSKKLHIKHYQNHVDDHYKNRINKSCEIEFNEAYIFGKESSGESKINIEEVESLIELKNRFFLKLKSGLSLIIPRTAIKNSDDFKNEIAKLNIPIIDELKWEFN